MLPRDPRWREGAILFNARRYFECHEVWEALWREITGPERELLQGLIQLAVAYYHATRGNRLGANYLYRRGRTRVAPWLPGHAGLSLAGLMAQMDRDFGAGTSFRAGNAQIGLAQPR